jgi:hypothetical protein
MAGRGLVYPAVRIDVGHANTIGDGPCYLENSEVTFTVLSI